MKKTKGSDFVLLDLFHHNQSPWVLFVLLVLVLLIALFGNTTIIILVRADPHLHSPMYFLLSQLSFMDILSISTFVPKMALDILSGNNHISFIGCAAHLFLFMPLVASECLLLVVMAYDCYVAICHSLRYPILTRPTICVFMVVGSWLGPLFHSLIQVTYILTLPYYTSREIHHFFCEIPALLKLVCAETSQYETGLFVSGIIFLLPLISAILVSYGKILSTVLAIGSSVGFRKALATCSSHPTVMSQVCGAAIMKYLLLKSYHSPEQDEVVSVFYTILMPMLNPLIYSLRNKDITRALSKVFNK